MGIIEKEIERRERLIAEKAEKVALVQSYREEIEVLEAEIESTDETELHAEIEELKTYLPKPDETVDPENGPPSYN